MDFFEGNGALELGQVKNSKFELVPNQVACFPQKSPLCQSFIFFNIQVAQIRKQMSGPFFHIFGVKTFFQIF